MVYKAGLICLYQGDDWAGLVTVNNCDGSPFDLTGYNVQAQIRQGPADQSWRISACFLPAIVLPNQISISLTHRQTAVLRDLNYCWDMQIVSPDGIITTIVSGQVSVTPQVTAEPRYWRRDEIDAFTGAWYGALKRA
jgi:hypothetical protein